MLFEKKLKHANTYGIFSSKLAWLAYIQLSKFGLSVYLFAQMQVYEVQSALMEAHSRKSTQSEGQLSNERNKTLMNSKQFSKQYGKSFFTLWNANI